MEDLESREYIIVLYQNIFMACKYHNSKSRNQLFKPCHTFITSSLRDSGQFQKLNLFNQSFILMLSSIETLIDRNPVNLLRLSMFSYLDLTFIYNYTTTSSCSIFLVFIRANRDEEYIQLTLNNYSVHSKKRRPYLCNN